MGNLTVENKSAKEAHDLGATRALEDYRELFYSNQAVMLMVEPETGRIVDANPAACAFYGYELEKLTSILISEINQLSPEEIFQRMCEAREKRQSHFLFKHRLASGDIRDVEVFSSPIKIQGRALLFSIVHDVTERVNAETSLIESEFLLRSVFDSTPDLLLLIDKELRIILSNWKGREFVPEAKRKGLPHCYKVFMGRDKPCEPCYAMEVFSSGRPLIYERFNPNPDVGYIEVHAYPIMGEDGGISLAVEHVRKINERKKAEREKAELEEKLQEVRRLESIGTLAGGIAHDFNNLLMAIMGNVSIMQMDVAGNKDFEDGLKKIEECVHRGADLTRQILGFARGGKYVIASSDLNALISQCLNIFVRTRKDITITLDKGQDICPVEVDRGQINQVLLNIFVNAGQAMPRGGEIVIETRKVTVDAASAKELNIPEGIYARAAVRDTGTGMDEKTLARIFEPFFTTKPVGQGTGLGLASAYGIIRNHGGMITAESHIGMGSTFTIYLPAGKGTVAEGEPENNPNDLKGVTALVVDDEELIRESVSSMLLYSGARVLKAESGEAAIRIYMANRQTIDIVILDMVMPVMRGGEVFERLKEINPSVRVLLSSGYTLNGEAEQIMKRGCLGFLQKPFNRAELTTKIRHLL